MASLRARTRGAANRVSERVSTRVSERVSERVRAPANREFKLPWHKAVLLQSSK